MKCLKVLERRKSPSDNTERLMLTVELPMPLPLILEPLIGVEYNSAENRITEVVHVLKGSGELAHAKITKEQEKSIIAFIESQEVSAPSVQTVQKENNEPKALNIELLEQECEGNYKFDGPLYVTKGIRSTFGKQLNVIIPILMSAICSIKKANYLQMAMVNGTKVYVIDDVDHVTILLPEEN